MSGRKPVQVMTSCTSSTRTADEPFSSETVSSTRMRPPGNCRRDMMLLPPMCVIPARERVCVCARAKACVHELHAMPPDAALFPSAHRALRCGNTSPSTAANGRPDARVTYTIWVPGDAAASCDSDAKAVAALMPLPTTSVRLPANLALCRPSTSGSTLHTCWLCRSWRSPSAGNPPGPHQLPNSLLLRSKCEEHKLTRRDTHQWSQPVYL